jgi:hypothetical protein
MKTFYFFYFLAAVAAILFITVPTDQECRDQVRARLEAQVSQEAGGAFLGSIAAAVSGYAVNAYTVEVTNYYIFKEIHLPGGRHIGYGILTQVLF